MKLCEEEKVYAQGDYSVFNTGLVTRLQEEIFALFQRNKKEMNRRLKLISQVKIVFLF